MTVDRGPADAGQQRFTTSGSDHIECVPKRSEEKIVVWVWVDVSRLHD